MYTETKYPDQINGLPKHGKEIWIAAYNAAYTKYDKDEEKATSTAWAATKNVYEQDEKSNWQEIKKKAYDYTSMILLSDVDTTDGANTWIDIIKEGTWEHSLYGQINITPEKLQKLAENFTSRILGRDLAITIEHIDKEGRIGEFKDVKIEGSTLRGLIEWTEKGAQLLADKAFKYFSPEYVENYIDKESKEDRGICLVGGSVTNKPFLTGMAPIFMSENPPEKDVQIMQEIFGSKKLSEVVADEKEIAELEQETRRLKYNIGIKLNGWIKPSNWLKHLDDTQFGDPVNYFYPIDSVNVIDSYRNFLGFGWGDESTNYYTDIEKKIVAQRIYDKLPEEYKTKAKEIMQFSDKAEIKLSQKGDDGKMEELKVANDKIDVLERQLSEVTTKQAVTEGKLWQAEVDATIKQFDDGCKIYPWEKPLARVILSHKDTAADVIKLNDVEGKEIAMTAREAYMEILRQRPAVIDLSERTHSIGEKTAHEMAQTIQAEAKADVKAGGY